MVRPPDVCAVTRYKDADDFDIATHPHFAGIGDYVQVVRDDEWVAAAVKMINERGAEVVLRAMLKNLREDFPPLEAERGEE